MFHHNFDKKIRGLELSSPLFPLISFRIIRVHPSYCEIISFLPDSSHLSSGDVNLTKYNLGLF